MDLGSRRLMTAPQPRGPPPGGRRGPARRPVRHPAVADGDPRRHRAPPQRAGRGGGRGGSRARAGTRPGRCAGGARGRGSGPGPRRGAVVPATQPGHRDPGPAAHAERHRGPSEGTRSRLSGRAGSRGGSRRGSSSGRAAPTGRGTPGRADPRHRDTPCRATPGRAGPRDPGPARGRDAPGERPGPAGHGPAGQRPLEHARPIRPPAPGPWHDGTGYLVRTSPDSRGRRPARPRRTARRDGHRAGTRWIGEDGAARGAGPAPTGRPASRSSRCGPLPLPGDVRGDLAVLVDDAHRLTRGRRRPGGRAGWDIPASGSPSPTGRGRAHRRWSSCSRCCGRGRTPAHTVVLGHAGRPRRSPRWADGALGATATPALVDFVAPADRRPARAGAPLLASLAAAPPGRERSGAGRPGPARRLEIPTEVDRPGPRRASPRWATTHRALLHALAAGAPLDADVLAEALGRPAAASAPSWSRRLRASGFLLASGDRGPPGARRPCWPRRPPDVTRGARRRLLTLLLDRGDQPVELARALVADGVRDLRAGRVLEEHGHRRAARRIPRWPASCSTRPSRAGDPGRALPPAAPRPPRSSATSTPRCSTPTPRCRTPMPPDRDPAAARGRRRAGPAGLPDPEQRSCTAPAGPEHAGTTWPSCCSPPAPAARRRPSWSRGERAAHAACRPCCPAAERAGRARGARLPADRAQRRRGHRHRCPPSPGRSRSWSRSGRTALMPDTPAALSALVALHAGEFAMAESVLSRALATELGGRPARPRHLLLLGWAAMLRGRLAAARTHLAEARAAAEPAFEPRDELCARALEMGVARRSSDLRRRCGPAGSGRGRRSCGTRSTCSACCRWASSSSRRPDCATSWASWRRTGRRRQRCCAGWAIRRCGRRRCTGAGSRRRSWPATPPSWGRTRAPWSPRRRASPSPRRSPRPAAPGCGCSPTTSTPGR